MTAMTLSFAVSSVILHERGGSAPLTDAGPSSAVTHDLAHSFDIAGGLPVKTDEGDESHHPRHSTCHCGGSSRIQRERARSARRWLGGASMVD
jgi:hypothetical protein